MDDLFLSAAEQSRGEGPNLANAEGAPLWTLRGRVGGSPPPLGRPLATQGDTPEWRGRGAVLCTARCRSWPPYAGRRAQPHVSGAGPHLSIQSRSVGFSAE
jgi:hypothetical protein